jgi:hypothetical protein
VKSFTKTLNQSELEKVADQAVEHLQSFGQYRTVTYKPETLSLTVLADGSCQCSFTVEFK